MMLNQDFIFDRVRALSEERGFDGFNCLPGVGVVVVVAWRASVVGFIGRDHDLLWPQDLLFIEIADALQVMASEVE